LNSYYIYLNQRAIGYSAVFRALSAIITIYLTFPYPFSALLFIVAFVSAGPLFFASDFTVCPAGLHRFSWGMLDGPPSRAGQSPA
jgi:hypothetical protein